MPEKTKVIRYRINVSTSVKGVFTFEATVESEGASRDELLAESDAIIAELKRRYPITEVK